VSLQSLTIEEKARVRHHMGYLGVDASQTFVLGIPAAVQTQFVIEGAMNRLLPESYEKVRQLLARLDAIEEQIVEDQELLAVSKVDEIDIRPDEFRQLVKQYVWWQSALANLFGIAPNPFDQRFSSWGTGAGGINVGVQN
jgi:hypothetical protein